MTSEDNYIQENLGIAVLELLELKGNPKHMTYRIIEKLLSRNINVGVRTTMMQALRERADRMSHLLPWELIKQIAEQDENELIRLNAYFALGSRIRMSQSDEAVNLKTFLKKRAEQEIHNHIKFVCVLASHGHNPPLEGHLLHNYTLDLPESPKLNDCERKVIVAIAVVSMNRLLMSEEHREYHSAKEVLDAMSRNKELQLWLDSKIEEQLKGNCIDYNSVLNFLGYIDEFI
ncbi:MAG: hypothetical protein PVH61_44280 [Candidatus Aminicenantes bacterium]